MKSDLFQNKPIILAPMAGVTDAAFRTVCAECGADLSYTEMVSAAAVRFNDKKTFALASVCNEAGDTVLQIFGRDPDTMSYAAQVLLSFAEQDGRMPVMLDVNMGCPVKKIVNNGEGSALMRDQVLAGKIVRALCDVSPIPVSVKIRAGWDKEHINAPEFAKVLEYNGASLITVHGRTRSQMYAPGIDLDVIKSVKDSVRVPVIGNGDIFTGADAVRMFDYTGCDGIMCGRGALGNPFIFEEIKCALLGKDYTKPSFDKIITTAKHHLKLLIDKKGERAIFEFRKHAAWYTKGMRGGAGARVRINSCEDPYEMFVIFDELYESNLSI